MTIVPVLSLWNYLAGCYQIHIFTQLSFYSVSMNLTHLPHSPFYLLGRLHWGYIWQQWVHNL